MSWDTRRWKKETPNKRSLVFHVSFWKYAQIFSSSYHVKVKLAHERTGECMAAVH